MYQPSLITAGDLETLKQQLRQELDTIAREMSQPSEYAALQTLYAEPKRVFDGMVVIADGTTWNPGSGAGPYARIAGAWSKMAAGVTFTLSSTVQTSATLNVSATSGVYVALCDCTSNAITVNLPTAVGNAAMIVVKKTDASANAVTVDGFSAQTIDGGATAVIGTKDASISLVSDGTNWSIV